MKLLTKELIKKLPPLYANEAKKISDPMVYVKFFALGSDWTWYVMEFDGLDCFWGMVHGFEAELGYFNLSELESLYYGTIPRVERDLNWKSRRLSELESFR